MSALTDSEREYVLARLDREHIAEIAERIRYDLEHDHRVEACYQPGDGTSYGLLFVSRGPVAGAVGGGTGNRPPSRYFTGDVVIVYGQRSTVFDWYEHCDIAYAAACLSDNRASALAISELLRAIFRPEES